MAWNCRLLSFLRCVACGFGLLFSTAAYSEPTLVIYADEQLLGRGSLGAAIFPTFEKKYRCKIKPVGFSDYGQFLSRLEFEQAKSNQTKTPARAHLLMGFDQSVWSRLKFYTESWGDDWIPEGYQQLRSETKIERDFLPFSYGILSFMVDLEQVKDKRLTEQLLSANLSVNDLLRPEWRRKVLLEDPRTSSVGLEFLLFTRSVFGDEVWKFWERFKSQWLTLTPEWEGAYRMFLHQEAPLVWSYVSSQAFHAKAGQQDRYRAVLFKEGQPYQVFGAALGGLSKRTKEETELSRRFLEFLISEEVQLLVPETFWILPARKNTSLPASFRDLPKPNRLTLSVPKPGEAKDLIHQWSLNVLSPQSKLTLKNEK